MKSLYSWLFLSAYVCLSFLHAQPNAPGNPSAARSILFVDDHDVLYTAGMIRTLRQPAKRPDNPLIRPHHKGHQLSYCSVHYDPESGKYQVWYQSYGGGGMVCYAESYDGITWKYPNLGIITTKNAPPNAVITGQGFYGAWVVADPRGRGDPARRYKMVYWSIPAAPKGSKTTDNDDRDSGGGMFVAFSPDGIHWEKHPEAVLLGSYGRSQQPPLAGEKYPWGIPSSVSDVLDLSFDAARQVYVVYSKAWIDAPDGSMWWKRSIMRTESKDFIKWSTPKLVMVPDVGDGLRPAEYGGTRKGVQLHGAPVFLHKGVYFALIQLADFETHGLQPIELAISRDGKNWSRPFRDKFFIPVGEGEAYDAGRIWSNATPVILDNEIRFYYGAYEHPWHFGKNKDPWTSRDRRPYSGIGLATLPIDRFASLRPIDKIGQITLKPVAMNENSRIEVNADARNGKVRVELLNEAGYRLKGFTQADMDPLKADGLRQAVVWKNGAPLPRENYIIRLHVENAEVFAVTVFDKN